MFRVDSYAFAQKLIQGCKTKVIGKPIGNSCYLVGNPWEGSIDLVNGNSNWNKVTPRQTYARLFPDDTVTLFWPFGPHPRTKNILNWGLGIEIWKPQGCKEYRIQEHGAYGVKPVTDWPVAVDGTMYNLRTRQVLNPVTVTITKDADKSREWTSILKAFHRQWRVTAKVGSVRNSILDWIEKASKSNKSSHGVTLEAKKFFLTEKGTEEIIRLIKTKDVEGLIPHIFYHTVPYWAVHNWKPYHDESFNYEKSFKRFYNAHRSRIRKQYGCTTSNIEKIT